MAREIAGKVGAVSGLADPMLGNIRLANDRFARPKVAIPASSILAGLRHANRPEDRKSPASDRIDAIDTERTCGLRAACRVLPPALLHRLIVLAGARTCIARLGVPIALEKEAEAVVAPVVAARNGDIDARPARHEAALGLVVQHRDELGAIVGLAA